MSLSALLRDRIRNHGPITVSQYMAEALGHPEFGYYMTRDPFGAQGDFTTAPEISQVFGELIGLWAAVTWQSMGAPPRLVLAEIGPGRGTLMADLLRAARTVPPFMTALEPWLVETSSVLRNRQAQTLSGTGVRWVERFEDLPNGPIILVANELWDALPIRQLEKQAGVWHERMVGLDQAGKLIFVTGDAVIDPPLAPEALSAPDGTLAEWGEAGRELAATVARRLCRQGGAALIIDYGSATSGTGDTLQAVKGHRPHPVLESPGEADLTAHVDFQAVAEAAVKAGAKAHGPLSQGRFLLRLGIEERTAMLCRNATAQQALDLEGRARRLIDPAEMGTLFQVLALANPLLPVPAGLET